jgi:site-specific DNA-methyltransferase (adenine-specific)
MDNNTTHEMTKYELHLGECLEVMATLAPASVDLILCDLPYGTTACAWDAVIPFAELWEQYKRVARRDAAIVLTASQPFTTALIASNMRAFKYTWVWDKENAANFGQAKYRPMKVHEDVCVFSFGKPAYFPIKTPGKPNHTKTLAPEPEREFMGGGGRRGAVSDTSGMKYPRSIQKFPKHPSQCGFHPTQKPVALMEYLIRTYTQEGETVLDNCMGSGTTGVAALNTGRAFVGIERDPRYFDVARERIDAAAMPGDLFAPVTN